MYNRVEPRLTDIGERIPVVRYYTDAYARSGQNIFRNLMIRVRTAKNCTDNLLRLPAEASLYALKYVFFR